MYVCEACYFSADTQTHVDTPPEINMVSLLPPQELGSGLPSGLGEPWRCLTQSFITQPLAGGTGVRGLLPQAAWLLRQRRGLSAACLQFGSTADGLVPNKPPKSADVLKAADTDGSALILPFSPAAREEREEEKQRQRLTLLSQSSAVLQGKIKLLSRLGADGTSSAQSV